MTYSLELSQSMFREAAACAARDRTEFNRWMLECLAATIERHRGEIELEQLRAQDSREAEIREELLADAIHHGHQ